MLFGKLVLRGSSPSLEILDLDGTTVIGYHDLGITGQASGSVGYIAPQPAPVVEWGQISYHFGYSTFDLTAWSSGPYSGESWEGHSYQLDITKFWTPSSISVQIETSVTDFFGGSFFGPGISSMYGHSESAQTLDIDSVFSGDGWLSFFNEHRESVQTFDYDHFAVNGFSYDSQHSEQSQVTQVQQVTFDARAGISVFDQLSVQNDTFDFIRIETPASSSVQVSSVHEDFDLATWSGYGEHGSLVASNYSSHDMQLTIGDGYSDMSIHDVAIQQSTVEVHHVLV